MDYLYNQALGQFIGFYVAIYSTGIVSTFFETRRISKLWGCLARKTVVEAGTFSVLERIVAVLIGFIVFEIVSTNLKPLLERLRRMVDKVLAQIAQERGWDAKWMKPKADLHTKRLALFSSVNTADRNSPLGDRFRDRDVGSSDWARDD
jgi:hypothetical protein